MTCAYANNLFPPTKTTVCSEKVLVLFSECTHEYSLFLNVLEYVSRVYSIPNTGVAVLTIVFYPTAIKGCRGIVFTHGVRMGGRPGGRLTGLYLRNRKV